jgi:hypothetical protein
LQSIELIRFDFTMCQEDLNVVPSWLVVTFTEGANKAKPANRLSVLKRDAALTDLAASASNVIAHSNMPTIFKLN